MSDASADLAVVCTARGTHKRRVLGYLSIGGLSTGGGPMREVVDVRISDSKAHRMTPDGKTPELLVARLDAIEPREKPDMHSRTYRYTCPSCSRDFRRRHDALLEIIKRLQPLGVDLDISYDL